MGARRSAVMVIASLVASLGVVVGSEVAVPPSPAAALPPAPDSGVSTFSGTGTRGRVDGAWDVARFDHLVDMAMHPSGEYLYTLEQGGSGRPNAIRRVDVATGEVSTFASGGLLQNTPTTLQVDSSGDAWVSVVLSASPEHKGIVRFEEGAAGVVELDAICCGYYGANYTGNAFFIDEEAGFLYYSTGAPPDPADNYVSIRRISLGALPAVASAGTSLGAVGPFTRGPVYDMERGSDGAIYVVWGGVGMAKVAGTTVSLVSSGYGPTNHLDRIAFAPRSSSVYHLIDQAGGFDGVGRRLAFGAGTETRLAGGSAGFADGDPGAFRNPNGLVLSLDGRIAYVADSGNYRIRRLVVPPDPGELSPSALCGPCNPGMRMLNAPQVADPVDVATGNLTESFTDLALPGRGRAVAAARTYNSYLHGAEGLFGPGWSSPLDMSLKAASGVVSITQESGAELSFWRSTAGVITAPPWVTSTLQEVAGGWRLDRNHGDIVTFDAQGRVTGWEDRNGYVTTVTRQSPSQIVMTSPGGRSLTFAVSGGLVTSVSDDSSPPRTVDYTYTSGLLTKVETFPVDPSDPGRVTWQYGYDTSGRLSSVTDPRGNANLTHYDAEGRVDHQLDHAGARTDIVYGGTYPDEWRTVTYPPYDASGTRATVRYQLDGLLTESITTGHGTPSARTTTYAYDPDTLGVETVTGPGAVTLAAYSYDASGNIVTGTDAAGRTTTLAYTDPFNPTSPTAVTDPDGTTSTMAYDGSGNLLSSSAPVVLTGSSTTYGVAVTTFERTDAAHPEDITAVVAPDQQGLPSPNKTELSYRAGDGQVEWVEDPEGNRTSFGYDSRGFVTSTVTPRGNATGTGGDHETTFAVNDFGMVMSVTDPLGEVSSQTYDGNGNVMSVTDANGQTTATSYDAMNRPRVVTRPDSTQVETTYFPDGGVRDQINGLSDATSYTYDVHGLVHSSVDPNGNVTGYRYDDLGRLIQRIDPGGSCPSSACTTYGYSSTTQELTSVSYSDPATPDVTAITYDPLGQRSGVTRSAGGAQSWAWDNLGQLRASTDVNGRTTAYDWTLNGNLASITHPGQSVPVSYTYDAADRMTSVSDWAGRTTTFGWTADSQWSTTTFPLGTDNVDTRTYDEAGRLTSVEWKQGSTSLGKLTYDRDPEGLLEAETPTGGTFSTKTWGYDDLDQLNQVDAASLALDDAGNLTRTEYGTFQVFDPAQQLCWTSPTATAGTCGSPTGDATTYAYDARGNRTVMDEPGPTAWSYGYDQENRMTSAVQRGEAPISEMTAAEAVAGDFDGDGNDDVFWYHPGSAQDWVSWGTDRGQFGLEASPYSVNSTAYEPFTGDFDGDGNDDIFWYAPGTAGDFVWFWFNDGAGDYTSKAFTVNGDYRPIVGDFDGDGYSDVYWYGPGSTADSIWWGNATVDTTSGSFTNLSVSRAGSYHPIAGDFDNNGADDIVWYQPGTGADVVWFSAGARNSWVAHTVTLNSTGWDLAVGDFDGDNKDDLFLSSTGGTQVWWGGAISTFGSAPNATWVTLAAGYQLDGGDFDGDGTDDLLVYDPTGTDTVWWGTTRSTFGTSGHTGLTPDPATATYAYDASGLRSAKAVNGTTTQFTWNTADGLPLLLDQHKGGATTSIVYGPGGTPLYEVAGSSVAYYHQDHQGSTRLTTDAAGDPVARYAYTAYGELSTNTAPSTPIPLLGYTGQYADPETGFIYLRARYLDPTTGQFTTLDPIVNQTRQPFSYASSNPIEYIDPSGFLIVGQCYAGSVGWLGLSAVQGCLVNDGDAVSVVGFAGGGLGVPGAEITNGFFYSNAESAEQLRGYTRCLNIGAGSLPSAAISICIGLDDEKNYDGVWSIYVGGGVAAKGLSVSVSWGETGVTELFCFGDPVEGAASRFRDGVKRVKDFFF